MSKRRPCKGCGSLDRHDDLIGYCSQVCRLATKFSITDSGCWEWLGGRHRGGYGKTSLKSADKRAHRFTYELLVADVPDSLVLDHLCRNPACINPDHLEPVTIAENVARSSSPSALNAAKTHCIHGHEFTPENTGRSLTQRVCKACSRESSRRYRLKRAGVAA